MRFAKSGVLVLSTILLSSCFFSKTPDALENSNPTNSDKVVEAQKDANTVVKDGDTIAVDYVGRLQDGTIFDASIQSEAKKSKNYSESREYAPLVFTVGAGQMIKGFDKGVVGMKVGEKKTLVLPPEEAYGTGGTERTVDAKAFQDSFTITTGLDAYKDTVRRDVAKKDFADAGKEIPSVGQVLTAGGISAKVVAVTDTGVTLDIENSSNPFYKKKLAVGLTGVYEGNTVKIKKLTSKDVTLEITNKANPFYGKKIKVGDSTLFSGKKITIKKIGADTITIDEAPELAGETLTFDIEVKEIK